MHGPMNVKRVELSLPFILYGCATWYPYANMKEMGSVI